MPGGVAGAQPIMAAPYPDKPHVNRGLDAYFWFMPKACKQRLFCKKITLSSPELFAWNLL